MPRRGRDAEMKACLENPYLMPRLYVEVEEGGEGEAVLEGDKLKPARCVGGGDSRCFRKAIYGTELEEIVDLVEKRVRRAFIVFPPGSSEGYLLEPGDYVEPIPVEGGVARLAVCEGDEVEEGTILGLVLTRKGEMRKPRSHIAGVVVYIYSSPEGPPDENIVFIAPREGLRRVKWAG